MSEPKRSWQQSVLEYLTMLGAAVAGLLHAPAWIAVPLAAVVLLWVSDRGQHRWLVDRFPRLPPEYTLVLSIGSHLALNLVATSASYILGVASRWVWLG